MSWLLFTLIAVVFWSFSNVIDRNLFLYYFKRPIYGLGFQAILCLAYATFSFIFFEVEFNLLNFLLGAIWLTVLLLYFKAMKVEEASRVAAYFSAIPAIVALLAYFFLGEKFGFMIYLGIGFIISGGILLSRRNFDSTKKFRISKALPYMLLYVLIYAGYSIWVKYLIDTTGFISVFSNMQLGIFALGLPFTLFYRKEILRIHSKGLLLFALSHFLAIIGLFSFIYSASLAPITLVSPILELQGAFVFVFAIFVTVLWPSFINEDITKQGIILKGIAITLMTLGSIMVSIYS